MSSDRDKIFDPIFRSNQYIREHMSYLEDQLLSIESRKKQFTLFKLSTTSGFLGAVAIAFITAIVALFIQGYFIGFTNQVLTFLILSIIGLGVSISLAYKVFITAQQLFLELKPKKSSSTEISISDSIDRNKLYHSLHEFCENIWDEPYYHISAGRKENSYNIKCKDLYLNKMSVQIVIPKIGDKIEITTDLSTDLNLLILKIQDITKEQINN